MDQLDDEILQSFVEESQEHLADIENDMLLIEQGGAEIDEELVNKVFRAAHSIKGGAGFMGLDRVKELSHKIENVLGMIRSREIVPNSEVVNICLLAFDKLREMIGHIEQSNDADISEHVVALSGITSSFLPEEEKHEVSRKVEICFPDGQAVFTVSEFDISHARKKNENLYILEYDLIHDVHKKGITPFELLSGLQKQAAIIDCKVDLFAVGTLEDTPSNRLPFLVLIASTASETDAAGLFGLSSERVHAMSGELVSRTVDAAGAEILPRPEGVVADEMSEASTGTEEDEPTQVEDEGKTGTTEAAAGSDGEKARPTEVKRKPAGGGAGAPASAQQNNLRVHVSLIDKLMNLAGELVLSRNQLVQARIAKDEKSLETAAQRISLVTSELQESIMLTRMQPVGNIFNKFPRLIRDLARDLDKKIELSISGSEVELDKTMIEGLGDPLTHIMRNAADHGIEPPQKRVENGKSETGHINLRAFHQAGQINIEIEDDGGGIDPEKVSASAAAKGLITEEQARTMSEKEKIALVFAPGFSTAQRVTDVSGRGVGMDVVKTNLEKLGGQVDIESVVGEGTTIRIKLPLTLAIIPSLMISSQEQRYAIPLVNVVELLRIPAERLWDRIERVGQAQVLRLRDELIALMSLSEIFSCDAGTWNPVCLRGVELDSQSAPLNVVVVHTGTFKYGLVVDRLHDSEEIVVKPLGHHLKKCAAYAGATIMGNGRVALILDAAGLARLADFSEIQELDDSVEGLIEAEETPPAAPRTLTVFGSGEESIAVPVHTVSRIEKIAPEQIETVDGKRIIKYRSGILPVHDLSELVNCEPPDLGQRLLVIVFETPQYHFGLLAGGRIDTLETSAAMDELTFRRPGVAGSMILRGNTTLLLDIPETAKLLKYGSGVESVEEDAQNDAAAMEGTVLYVEDSAFFRGQIRSLLEEMGCGVLEAADGKHALEILENDHERKISLVVADIEMPVMDGYEMASKIKSDARFAHIPVLALTTLASEKNVAKGKMSGIDDYLVKLDKDQFIETVSNYLRQTISQDSR